METAAAVEKPRTVFPQQLAKRLLAFRTVPTGPAAAINKTTKPDRSLATKTGHFYLLPTGKVPTGKVPTGKVPTGVEPARLPALPQHKRVMRH